MSKKVLISRSLGEYDSFIVDKPVPTKGRIFRPDVIAKQLAGFRTDEVKCETCEITLIVEEAKSAQAVYRKHIRTDKHMRNLRLLIERFKYV